MTAFNAEKHIKRVGSAVLNQKYTDFELLVINDASQDSTLKILKSIKNDRLKIYDNEINSGTYFSRNIGILHSKGEFLAFVDSDDLVSPNRFLNIINYLKLNKSTMHIETRYVRFYEDTNELWFRDWTRGVGYPVIRKKVVDDIGYFLPVRANGDMEYAARIKNYYGKDKMELLNDFTYWGSQGPNKLTTTILPNGPERTEFQDYVFNVFHKSNKTYVAFPFEKELISKFKDFKLFSKSAIDNEIKVKVIESIGNDLTGKDYNELQNLLTYSEKCNNEFYSEYLFYKSELNKIKRKLNENEGQQQVSNNKEVEKSFSPKDFERINNELNRLNETRDRELGYYKNIYENMPNWWKKLGSFLKNTKK